MSQILVVDDCEQIRTALSRAFHLRGYQVRTATDGSDGLNTLLAVPCLPDLIVLDLLMPGSDGRDLRMTLLDIPALATIPVVVFSGSGSDDSLDPIPGVRYVAKPRVTELFSLVESLVPVRRTAG